MLGHEGYQKKKAARDDFTHFMDYSFMIKLNLSYDLI